MKKLLFTFSSFAFVLTIMLGTPDQASGQGIAINNDGSTPNASAMLDVKSTTKGFLLPRMTTAQQYAIIDPAPGLMIFNTDHQSLQIFTTAGWIEIKIFTPPVNKLWGGNGFDEASDIQQTSDGGYIITGYSSSSANGDVTSTNHGGHDYWILKSDNLGNITWNKLLGGSGGEFSTSIRQTSDGGYIIAGTSNSSSNGDVSGVNHGSSDFWIVKLDQYGNIVWNKLLGGNGQEEAYDIQQTADGGYIVTGYSSSSANGDVSGTSHGGSDYWVVKLDASGNISWNKLLGGDHYEFSTSIQQTSDGGYIVAGFSPSTANGDVTGINHGVNDFWIVKLDVTGNITWNKLLGGNEDERAHSVQQTTDGGYIVAGYAVSTVNGDVSGTNHGHKDYWVVKLDASGNKTWDKLLGGNGADVANNIIQTADGGYIVAGISLSSANGDVTAFNQGHGDSWIVKIDGSGNIVWNKLLGGTEYDEATGIRKLSDGRYIVLNTSRSSLTGDVPFINHGNSDYWVIKLDVNGNFIH